MVVALWAGNFVVSKVAIATLPPMTFAAIRFGLASAVLLALLRWREGRIRPPRGEVRSLVVLGVVGYGLYQLLWLTALQTVPAGDSALLIAATPVLTGLLAVALGSDVLTPPRLAGTLIALGGVALVVGVDSGFDLGSSILGDGLTLLAAGCWAVYTAWGALFLGRLSPLLTTTWAVVFGTLAMAPIGLAQLAGMTDPGPALLASVGAILYSGLLSAGLPNVAVFHAVKLLGPTRVTAYQFLVPAITVGLAAVFLAEPVLLGQVVGGAVIVAGVLLTRRDVLAPSRLRRPRRVS